jgi:hypothetical protein
MKQRICRTTLALVALLLAGIARPGTAQAQQPGKDFVAFKATFKTKNGTFPILADPPLLSWENALAGEASFLGPFTGHAHAVVHLGVDGIPLFINDGILHFVAANGDAIYQRWAIVFPAGTGAWTITGGKGRFAGASGSGTFTAAQDPAKPDEVTITATGVISAPK